MREGAFGNEMKSETNMKKNLDENAIPDIVFQVT